MKITRKWLMENRACKDSLAAWNEAELIEVDAEELVEKLCEFNRMDWAFWVIRAQSKIACKFETFFKKHGYKIARDGDNVIVNAGEKYVALAGTQKSVTVNGGGEFEAYDDSRQATVTVNSGAFRAWGKSRQATVAVNGGAFRAHNNSRQTSITLKGGGLWAYNNSRQTAVTVNGGWFGAYDESRQASITLNRDGWFEASCKSKQKKIIRRK